MAIFFLFAQKGPTICCRLPDKASFLEIGGVYHPLIPPPGVSALNVTLSKKSLFSLCNLIGSVAFKMKPKCYSFDLVLFITLK